jgi:hypothetical protein
MRKYVQLKDGIVFAFHNTENEIIDETGNVIEISAELDGAWCLNKQYVDGKFIEIPIIEYAVLNKDDKTIKNIKTTYFPSEVNGKIIDSNAINGDWTWDGEQFVAPVPIVSEQITETVVEQPPVLIPTEYISG